MKTEPGAVLSHLRGAAHHAVCFRLRDYRRMTASNSHSRLWDRCCLPSFVDEGGDFYLEGHVPHIVGAGSAIPSCFGKKNWLGIVCAQPPMTPDTYRLVTVGPNAIFSITGTTMAPTLSCSRDKIMDPACFAWWLARSRHAVNNHFYLFLLHAWAFLYQQ